MVDLDWVTAPIGIDAKRWVSRPGCRTVLIAVHTMVSCHRLLDVVDLIESDDRLQIVFTVGPDAFNTGVAAHLQRLGALVIPWRQAAHESFDLAIAAAHGGLHELHAPVMLMAHGAGHARMFGVDPPTVYGLDAPRLMRDGRVIASALMLSHENELHALARQCPEALPIAGLAGDPCFDRLTGSLRMRSRYRRALGVANGRELVAVSSTWGKDGLFGGAPRLLGSLMAQLPGRKVALLLHPAILGAHGSRQVGAWLRPSLDAGLILADPAEDWRPYIAAADRLIGDRGSVTAYGAATGLPVLCFQTSSVGQAAAGSPQSIVLDSAARLEVTRPLAPQVDAAAPVDHQRVAAAITSRPGRSAGLLRQAVYRLLGLPERRARWSVPPAPVSLRPGS